MPGLRTSVLSIAGYDPSGGAGLLADIKTFEAHKVLGMGVCTALTFQNDREFEALQWTQADDIIRQIEILQRQFQFKYAKIGLIESLEVLGQVIDYMKVKTPSTRIILDPIFKASAGFDFHQEISQEKFLEIAGKLYLITPNWTEIQQIFPEKEAQEGAKELSLFCKVYLKGGHNPMDLGKDFLYHQDKIYPLNPKTKNPSPKHGSGCVLSSAITANLAKEYPLLKACLKAKTYISRFLDSNPTLLGYHP
ncbi:MAG: hydroxymethylpyrimidine/phosphomethylpyrimidine kinase [Microscillaceae bacterium]|nr:hydroxymethylpyrimidine/phosphomethylpyrimidine kinase [Microscillaceae bacterium]